MFGQLKTEQITRKAELETRINQPVWLEIYKDFLVRLNEYKNKS